MPLQHRGLASARRDGPALCIIKRFPGADGGDRARVVYHDDGGRRDRVRDDARLRALAVKRDRLFGCRQSCG